MKNSLHGGQAGQLSLQVLVIGAIGTFLIMGFVLWADTYVRSVSRSTNNSQAFTIAEAGIEYYRWHLAHAPMDFKDGNATSTGPYIHPYYDKNGDHIGEFSLVMTQPATGTTIVAIQATGKVDADPTVSKIIKVKMGLPSFARYSVAANADMRFGEGTNIYGQVHSNGGIRFDGVAYNTVTSAKANYDDPDHSGGNEFGVHTHHGTVDPLPPNAVPVRTDVFKAGRSFPVPAIDFNGITQNLSAMKTAASSSSGYYKGASGALGYDIVLKTNDTFDIYKVTGLTSLSSNCSYYSYKETGWGSWSISSETLLASNVAFPANGTIFIEDNLWIRGQITTARLNIGAGRFPVNASTYASITINNSLMYTNHDGQDVLGLISQNNINVGFGSDNNLSIDAALVAQNGRVGRYHYSSMCGTGYTRNSISLYGMLATNQRYGFAWTDNTGYVTRNITYDANLLYGPPPGFPITGSQYDIISWDEVK